jgi:hypothetical protein
MAKATQYGVLVLTCGTLLSSQGTNAHEFFPFYWVGFRATFLT